MSKVLVLSRQEVRPFYGVVPSLGGFKDTGVWYGCRGLQFMERAEAENDPRFKQLIPYCLTSCVFDGEVKYLSYRRSPKGGESRLYGLMSIGIGGHVDESDQEPNGFCTVDMVRIAARREIGEELQGVNTKNLCGDRPLCMVNHDDTHVAAVHLGIVFDIRLPEPPTGHSGELLDLQWYSLYELKDKVSEMEGWSEMLTKWLITDRGVIS